MHNVMSYPAWHAPFDQNNSAANAHTVHAQVAQGMEAAYETRIVFQPCCKLFTVDSIHPARATIGLQALQALARTEREKKASTTLSSNCVQKQTHCEPKSSSRHGLGLSNGTPSVCSIS